ncbi:amidohydrolase family protein [Mycolicibacterium palauense]|uniref:amidohydrolase family protein n=1 Tax=Mycolicibacterium palauense TaxID=2034511 RepID=UPI000BFEEAB9|nr:amidohydrolase family protein [Mycolicibacterium palauense]
MSRHLMTGFVDVHSHNFPVLDAAERETQNAWLVANHFAGPPAPAWAAEAALSFMDTHGIRLQLLSMPVDAPVERVREINDRGAAAASAHPDRFGFLATVPVGDPGGAVDEIARVADELGADGFVMTTNCRGTYFGDPLYDPVFAELDRRRATVFVHPSAPAGLDLTACGRPGPVLEFVFDTPRTVVDAVFARVFQRYPNLRMVLAHGGGALPAVWPRVAALGPRPWVPNPQAVTAEDIVSQLAGLYYDTANAAHSVAPLLELTTADHILFGTDYPLAQMEITEAYLRDLGSSTALSEQEFAALPLTALALFPTLRARLPDVAAAPARP